MPWKGAGFEFTDAIFLGFKGIIGFILMENGMETTIVFGGVTGRDYKVYKWKLL